MTISGKNSYFFCGVGGSGMSPLAAIMAAQGHSVSGSDRSYDQGKTPQKFAEIEQRGISLAPQDGSGLSDEIDALIVSSAVEDSIPDVAAAKAKNIPIRKRAELLAEMFNGFETGISIAGTSGKSTVTGMVASTLTHAGQDPTVMNGGVIKNFEGNMRSGQGGVFVTETDESDGSIALYNPAIAVLNNIALDHKSIEELESLFGEFISRASRAVVLNFDDQRLKALAQKASVSVYSYALEDAQATLKASDIAYAADSVSFTLTDMQQSYPVKINQPGAHNVSNALAALCVCKAMDVDMNTAIAGLESFIGIARRMDVVGTRNDITVIDDFGHNPDKIAATLKTLKTFPGRLIVMFQPHGYGPMKLLGEDIAASFAEYLEDEDVLLMPEPYYAGGTADRSVGAKDVAAMIAAKGKHAQSFETREDTRAVILERAQSGDRIVIMGARDDTLSDFAREILEAL